ncbi:hemerythrin domain-containing protein [Sphingosinicella soli]|uniref:Hemerythrin superfamily protein n=1 Tax=Sphingosinicella soli TaxID=333708 RepID=A0A7W7B1S4_9SPHN|nr:hemerythrin domain-containing protein [Sphingosinicella soli]MBB4632294.1 hemerythrin superfamily protein [Sphingosinicella soli]
MTDVFKLLKADHDRHRAILAKLDDLRGDSAKRRELFEDFRIEVTAHANAEEQSLYSVMLGNPELQKEGRHSVAEHKEIDDFLEELQDLDMATPEWDETFRQMKHRYEHHIDEEEEDIFPAAEEELSRACENEMGEVFAERKAAEKAEIAADT